MKVLGQKQKVVKLILHRSTEELKQVEPQTSRRTYTSNHRSSLNSSQVGNKEVYKRDGERGRGEENRESSTYITTQVHTRYPGSSRKVKGITYKRRQRV